MLIDKSLLEYYLGVATERKDEIKSIYNEVLEYTDPFAKIDDSGRQTLGAQREVDSTVVDSIDALKSFIMSSILPRTGSWASIEIDEKKLIDEQGEGAQSEIDEVKKVLDDNVSKVFRYIQGSNYYTEISKAVDSFIKVGTGAYAIRETGSTSKPFTFSYVGLDNLFILESINGRADIIFKLHPEVNGDYIMDMFGKDCVLPEGVAVGEPESVVDIYEVVIPEYDEVTTLTKYNYMITTSDFESAILEQELEYSPLICFRWSNIEGNPWGKSNVLMQKAQLIELAGYKELYVTQAKRIANPPSAFVGNQELFYSLDLTEGSMNYLGDPSREGVQGSLQYLSTNSNLMPLDKVIEDARAKFRQSLMVDSLMMGDVSDGKNVTAQFVAMKQEMFRKRFANTYELINSELLEPTFLAPLNIMIRYGMLDITTDVIPYANLKYVNALSKSSDMGDVSNFVQYTDIVANLNQKNAMGVAFNLPKAVSWVADKMSINLELIPSEQELEAIKEMQAQQAQMMAEQAQMMAQTGEGMA